MRRRQWPPSESLSPMDSAKSETRVFSGIGASPGIAIGKVRMTDRSRVAVVEAPVAEEEIPFEVERFKAALAKAREDLQGLKQQIAANRGPEHLYVIDAHLLILEDSMLSGGTVELIEKERINAEAALKRNLLKIKEFFAGIEDEYLRERGADIETVVERILRNMTGKRHEPISSGEEGKSVII